MRQAYLPGGLGLTLALLALPLCAGEHHHHEHKPPHGGTLVVLGEEAAHLELVLDAATGKLTAYVLDGEAQQSLRVKQKEIEVRVSPDGKKDDSVAVVLKGVANILTGETEGDTSQFEGQAAILKGAARFGGVVSAVTVRGAELKGVAFRFPEGNEEAEK
jgi:hypothetical protein